MTIHSYWYIHTPKTRKKLRKNYPICAFSTPLDKLETPLRNLIHRRRGLHFLI